MRSARGVVWGVALLAVLARFPSALWPMRPDEAGFLLVSRSWDPLPDSMYGAYWVDRPPQLIALVALSDWIGGEYALRVVAAGGLGALVLLAAATARRLAEHAGLTDRRTADRVAVWTAVVTAALASNAAIDAVSAKGEVLAIPLVMAACWLSLGALAHRSSPVAFAAGLVAMAAVGLKQNIVGGLVFGGVLLLGALVSGRIDLRTFGRLAGSALLGASIPVAATVVWALLAGVELGTVWYAVVGFRADAYATIVSQPSGANGQRAAYLLETFVDSGMALVVGCFLLGLPWLLRRLPLAALAVGAMLAVDGAGLFLSGSYWRTYLTVPVPALALALGCVLVSQSVGPRSASPGSGALGWLRARGPAAATGVVVATTAVSAVLSLVEWTADLTGGATPTEYYTGEGIGRVARPGDTLVVYGGRADIQLASGLRSPYEHLWSLPMRTLDPDLRQLEELLTGPQAPTWFVEFTYLDTWTEAGSRSIEPELIERYELVTEACGQYRVYHLNTVSRQTLEVDCDTGYRRFFGRPF